MLRSMASARAFAIFFSLVLVAAAAGFAWWRAHGMRWDGAVPFDPAFHRLTPEEVITLPLASLADLEDVRAAPFPPLQHSRLDAQDSVDAATSSPALRHP